MAREVTSRLVTYKDLIDHCVDYLGSNVASDASRDSRRAAQAAYRNVAACHNWSYYYTRGRLATVASQSDGTIEFDYTGGAYERVLTLTDSTWPSWAAQGTILINNVTYQVASRQSSTEITLAYESNPGADIAADTTYTLYRDTYTLPVDFAKADQLTFADQANQLRFVHPSTWLAHNQAFNMTPGRPYLYSFTSDPDYQGVMAVRFGPPPDDVYSLDYVYKRQPRPLLLDEYKEGTATCTASSATVTGTNTAWTANMVGSVIRFSSSTTVLPTGLSGTNAFQIQRVIVSVESETSLTVDQVAPATLTGVKYTISDPVDIEVGTMLTFLHREMEKELRVARRMPPMAGEDGIYMQAMKWAMEADSRSFARRVQDEGAVGRRLQDYPAGSDQG